MSLLFKTRLIVFLFVVLNFVGCKTEEPLTLPKLTTTSVSKITESSVSSGGKIISNGGADILSKGICWGVNPNPTTTDSVKINEESSFEFICNLAGLLPNTNYYIRAFAINNLGVAYGEQVGFVTKTLDILTSPISEITVNSAKSGCVVTIPGDTSEITECGLCWDTLSLPTISKFKTISGNKNGEYPGTLSNLKNNTTYFVRAYAINKSGTYYGNEQTFKTLSGIINLITSDIKNITVNSATSGGEITDDGGAFVISRGVCWSVNNNPTINDEKTENGTGMGIYASTLAGLKNNTTYIDYIN